MHRFRNLTNGTYLFSAYESEKQEITANYPTIFAYEGISYYVRVSPPPTDNNITAVVKDGAVVLPAAATSGSNTVAPLKAGGVQIDSSDISVANLKPNDIVHIAPRAGGLAFPFAGKVTSTTTVNGKQQVRLIPANVEDVYDSISWDIDTARSNVAIGGMIAPQNARASFSQTRLQNISADYKPMLSVSDGLALNGTKLSGTVEISHDLVDGGGNKVTLVAKVDVNNLSVRSKAEFDPNKFATGGGWAKMSAVIKGDIGGSVSLSGKTDADLGSLLTNTDVWNQLKWNGGDAFTLEGLDRKDKAGRIPLGGIILVPYATTTFTGNLPSSVITLLSIAPSAVLWLYLDMSGNITAEGEMGWRAADFKFERGYDLVANGLELQATKINNNTPGRQELFANEKIRGTQRVGITVAADVIVGGIRPLNVNTFVGTQWNGGMEGEGIRELMPTNNLTGSICVKNKVWLGAELNMSARVKAKVKADLYFFDAVAEGLVQKEYSEKVVTWLDLDTGPACLISGLFSISASVQGLDAAIAGNSLVNINFTPAYNNASIAAKTDHWWVKASCAGCADINVEIPKAQAGISTISLPNGKNYTLKLEAKSDYFGVVKSATTTVNVLPTSRYELVPKAAGGYYDKTECVRDKTTGLIWQGQTAAGTGLRANDQYKTNYDSTTALQKWNGATLRAPTQAEIDATTNSIGFKNAVNLSNLCGSSAWRLPTKDELLGIVKTTEAPTIDNAWFPNTPLYGVYWSSSPFADAGSAWNVYFGNGDAGGGYRDDFGYDYFLVRLVR